MIKQLVCFVFVSFIAVHATQWSDPGNISTGTGAFSGTTLGYASSTNQVFAAWSNYKASSPTYYPTYSIASYSSDGTWSWSTPQSIDTTTLANAFVTLCYNSTTNQMFAAWCNALISYRATAAIASYSNGSWTWSTPVSIGGTGLRNVSLAYASQTNQIAAVWRTNSSQVYYSIASYSGGSWSWSTPAQIYSGADVFSVTSITYDSSTNQLMVVWDDNNTLFPYYSIGSYSSSSGNWSWSAPAAITNSSSINFEAGLCYASTTNQILADWAPLGVPSYPYYSVASYSAGNWSWSSPDAITTGSQVKQGCFLCYNVEDNQVFAGWSNNSNAYPTYAIASYAGGNWSWGADSPITTQATAAANVAISYVSGTGQMLAAWNTTSNVYYSTYQLRALPPTALQGVRYADQYITQTEFFNHVSWSASLTPGVIQYNVYRDAALTQLISSVLATEPLMINDHNLQENGIYTYYITAIGSNHTSSQAASVTVYP